MKNIYLVFIIIILSIIAYFSSPNKNETAFLDEEQISVTIKDSISDTISTLDLEDYVIGVVAGEMPASFEIEALKAQAVAARTYALYKINTSNASYDLLTDITNQVYLTKEEMQEKWQEDYEYYYEKIKQAVSSTNNLVMKYDGEIISAYYFAMSNGKTENVSLVFGESKDYLVSVDSSWDLSLKNFSYITTFSKEDFCTKLSIKCSNISINSKELSSSGRINSIVINNKTFKGTEVRSLLNLRSTDFDIVINNDEVKITTKGYGHGVGMSQYGANEMAKTGKTYDEILKYYYQNIDITKINV